MDIFSKVWFYYKYWTFPFKNETQHHSNDYHGWPYSTPFERLVEDLHFYRKIIFSDEAISTSEAMSISRIVTFGAQKIQTSSLRSWCAHKEWLFGADFGTVASYEQGAVVTVNGERYRAMLNEFLFPEIEEDDMDDIWFQ